jgi:hypothetical protein
MTRDELYAAVRDDLNYGSGKDSRFPEWLASAEHLINTQMRVEEMVKHAALPITEMRFPVPPDYLAPKTLSMAKQTNTDGLIGVGAKTGSFVYIPPDQLDRGLDISNDLPRAPGFYTVRGRYIELHKWTLDGDYITDMWYYAELPKFASGTSTNWLLTKAPHIYRLCMSSFGYDSYQEFDRGDALRARVAAEIMFMNDQSAQTQAAPGPLIMRPPRRLGGRHS